MDALNNSLGFTDSESMFRYFSKTSFSPNGINGAITPTRGSTTCYCERALVPGGIRHLQSLSRRRALPFSSFSVSSGPSGNVFSHSVPGGFSANG